MYIIESSEARLIRLMVIQFVYIVLVARETEGPRLSALLKGLLHQRIPLEAPQVRVCSGRYPAQVPVPLLCKEVQAQRSPAVTHMARAH